MGRAKRLEAGTRENGLAIEYVRTRKVLRLLGWLRGEVIDPVEIPVDRLCQLLDIDGRDLAVPRHFLLFTGSHRRPAGGLRDLVGTFESEEKAWQAFREARHDHPSTEGWAQLAAVDGRGQVHQLAWFGLHPAGPAQDADEDEGPVAGAEERALRRLILAPGRDDYLAVVTPS